jgi:hypothetical protein
LEEIIQLIQFKEYGDNENSDDSDEEYSSDEENAEINQDKTQ